MILARLEMDTRAWRAGWDAGQALAAGELSNPPENPYSKNSADYFEWDCGFCSATDDEFGEF